MVNVGIGITDLGYQKGSFIYSDDISNGIHTSGGDKKINDAISSLQSMFRKVKDGGNAIIAACQVIAKTEVLLEEISQKQ